MSDFEVIKIVKVNDEEYSDLKGFAEVRIGLVRIRSIRILQTNSEPFCALPRERFYSKVLGRFLGRAIVHILSEELKAEIYSAILEKWRSNGNEG